MNLDQRMARIERENRIHRALWGVAVLLVLAFVVWGHAQPIPDVIQARSIQVVDAGGRRVAALDAMDTGGILRVFNKAGKAVAAMQVSSDGSGSVSVFNNAGVLVAALQVSSDGSRRFSRRPASNQRRRSRNRQ